MDKLVSMGIRARSSYQQALRGHTRVAYMVDYALRFGATFNLTLIFIVGLSCGILIDNLMKSQVQHGKIEVMNQLPIDCLSQISVEAKI